jgi:YHS domain-containing protein
MRTNGLLGSLTAVLMATAVAVAAAGVGQEGGPVADVGIVERVAAGRGLTDEQAVRLRKDRFDLSRAGLAIEGYDPVAYFPEGGGRPTKGKKELSVEHRGVTYRFANAANRDRFVASPATYEPAYGGWCAYAMGHEDYTEPNPKRFSIEHGRLLLFYDGLLGDTLKSWNEEGPAVLTPKADAFWTQELEKAADKLG